MAGARDVCNRRRMARTAASLVALAVLALACTSTRLTSVTAEPTLAGRSYPRLMVVAMGTSEGARASYEHAFVDRLVAIGASGVASSSVFPFQGDLRETVGAWVREQGIGGVLVTRLVDVRRDVHYVPPTTTVDLYGYYGFYSPAMVTMPGRVYEETRVLLETSLFDVESGSRVYVATSESFNPTTREKAVRDVVDALVGDLQKRGVLPKGKEPD